MPLSCKSEVSCFQDFPSERWPEPVEEPSSFELLGFTDFSGGFRFAKLWLFSVFFVFGVLEVVRVVAVM